MKRFCQYFVGGKLVLLFAYILGIFYEGKIDDLKFKQDELRNKVLSV